VTGYLLCKLCLQSLPSKQSHIIQYIGGGDRQGYKRRVSSSLKKAMLAFKPLDEHVRSDTHAYCCVSRLLLLRLQESMCMDPPNYIRACVPNMRKRPIGERGERTTRIPMCWSGCTGRVGTSCSASVGCWPVLMLFIRTYTLTWEYSAVWALTAHCVHIRLLELAHMTEMDSVGRVWQRVRV
jgi:hypothetical protein